MGERRLTLAAVLLGAFSLLAAALAAPLVFHLAVQPDSASAVPGGTLVVTVHDAGDPVFNATVHVIAADDSWERSCQTNLEGFCRFLSLPGTKGTVTAGDAQRPFFLPESRFARWDRDVAAEDDGTPLGLGPRDAIPPALTLVASLFGLAAAVAMYRRTAVRLAMVGVGLSIMAHLFVFFLPGLAIAGFAGYALVKDARLFDAVPLDDTDRDEEE